MQGDALVNGENNVPGIRSRGEKQILRLRLRMTIPASG
jgi:hypothetical protein